VLHRSSAKCTHENPLNNDAYIFPIASVSTIVGIVVSTPLQKPGLIDRMQSNPLQQFIITLQKNCINLHIYIYIYIVCVCGPKLHPSKYVLPIVICSWHLAMQSVLGGHHIAPPSMLNMWPCKQYFSHPRLVIYFFFQPRTSK